MSVQLYINATWIPEQERMVVSLKFKEQTYLERFTREE